MHYYVHYNIFDKSKPLHALTETKDQYKFSPERLKIHQQLNDNTPSFAAGITSNIMADNVQQDYINRSHKKFVLHRSQTSAKPVTIQNEYEHSSRESRNCRSHLSSNVHMESAETRTSSRNIESQSLLEDKRRIFKSTPTV